MAEQNVRVMLGTGEKSERECVCGGDERADVINHFAV